MNSQFKWIVGCGLLFLTLILAGGGWLISKPYSSGHRDGYVQKFSRKGFIRKSWEGELTLVGGAPIRNLNALGNVWQFTVTDPEVIKAVEQINARQLVRLSYDEYMWVASGYTNYRITKVRVLGEE